MKMYSMLVHSSVAAFVVMTYNLCSGYKPQANNDIKFRCGKGYHVLKLKNSTWTCAPCEGKTYMDESYHTNLRCKICSDYSLEQYLVKSFNACTPDRDAIIRECHNGYYIENTHTNYRCRVCPRCGNHIPECCTATTNARTLPDSKKDSNNVEATTVASVDDSHLDAASASGDKTNGQQRRNDTTLVLNFSGSTRTTPRQLKVDQAISNSKWSNIEISGILLCCFITLVVFFACKYRGMCRFAEIKDSISI